MIRERTRHRKNLFQRILSIMLVFALAAASALGTGTGIRAESGGEVIYLDGVSGDNGRDGKSEDEAVATFSKAKELVGDRGTIRVCGTVTVSDSQSWSLGGGVSLKRAHGFADAVAHVTGSLKLSGITLYNKDITGSGSVSGLAGRSPAADITVPSTVTLVQPKALSEVSLSDQCFGVGTFVWADGSFVPDKYETQAQVIFTPSDTDEHDYSGLKGWNGESVVRKVKVLTQSFLEEEKKEDGSGGEDQAGADEKPEDADKADGDKTDGAEASGDEKPEDGSGKEDGKADSDPGKDDTGDGKTDSEPGKDGQDAADEKPDTEPGRDQNPDGGEADAPKDDSAKQPDGGEADAPKDDGAKQPDGGSDAPAGEEQPGDSADAPVDGSEPDDQQEEKPAGETDGGNSGEQPAAEDKKDEAAEAWNVEKVEQLLVKLPETISSQSDVDAVVQASGAYEKLSDEDQAAVSGELLDRLYDAQTRVLGYNRVSLGVSVQGDLPWYIQFRASITKGRKIDDSTMRTLLGSYEFKLWNLVTDSEYKLNGRTVTVLMAAPAVKDTDIVIYHYLEDGTVEQIIPEIVGDQMSFVTSSFSPFSVIGVSVAGSTELVGSTGFSYVDKNPGTGSGSTGNKSGGTGNKNSSSSSTGNRSSSTGNRNTGSGSSSSARSNSSSGTRQANAGSSTGSRRAAAVGTGDTNNLLGYAMVGSGAAILMLFAAYMVYVQYKRKSYSRRP